jgi:hypothetical protein
VMQHDRTPVAPRRPASKRCSACGETKPASEFYVSRGRLSSYCKRCQRRVSNDAYHRRRQDAAESERMRQLDRARKRAERARAERARRDAAHQQEVTRGA